MARMTQAQKQAEMERKQAETQRLQAIDDMVKNTPNLLTDTKNPENEFAAQQELNENTLDNAPKLSLSHDMLGAFIDGILGDETEFEAYAAIDLTKGYGLVFEKELSRLSRVTLARVNPLERNALYVRRVIFSTLDNTFRFAEQRINFLTGDKGKFAKLCDGVITSSGNAVPSSYGFMPNTDKATKDAIIFEFTRSVTYAYGQYGALLQTTLDKQAQFGSASVYAPTDPFNMLKRGKFVAIMAQFNKDFPATK